MPRNVALALLLVFGLGGCAGEPGSREVTVFAAASLRDVLVEIGTAFETASGVHPIFNFAGSNTLAQQIGAAPVADVFLSASESWMDTVERAGRLVPGSRKIFLSNRLVVIANAASALELPSLEALAGLDFRHLSLGDPAGVPAGRYARELLESVALEDGSLWQRLEPKVVPAPDVRAALALVEAEPAAVGIVYHTDAAGSGKVRVLYKVPVEHSPEIRYVAAAIAGAPQPELASAFLDFLAGPQARAVFERVGFGIPGEPEAGG